MNPIIIMRPNPRTDLNAVAFTESRIAASLEPLDLVRNAVRTKYSRQAKGIIWKTFDERLSQYFPTLQQRLGEIYGHRADYHGFLAQLIATAWEAWFARPDDLKELDLQRGSKPYWHMSNQIVGATCYVDLFAGSLAALTNHIPYLKELGINYLHLMPLFRCPDAHNDGGYAVSSYREVNPSLGNIEDLRSVAKALRENGIGLALDFVFNHTSNEHKWAKKCAEGDPHYADFYFIFPDRSEPDTYEKSLREIFPDEHQGAFTQLPDGRWVWTTFHSYQWDLNYGNPAVFNSMAEEMLFIANLGTEVLRLDAVPFVWKEKGESCEGMAKAHTIIKAFNALARIAAPSLVFKSEAIVHPDEVVSYNGSDQCQLSYNPLQMALLWNSLATREVNLLAQALDKRHNLEPGSAWVNYVRCHDDIGWTFANEDAKVFGIDGYEHRKFLNNFYVGRFPNSFSRGVPFQENPKTGDCRVSGTCASLAGLELGDTHAIARILLLHSVAISSGGIPLLYLGDEVGTLNDYSFRDEPGKAGDSRWVHRPKRDAERYANRNRLETQSGQIFQGLRRLIKLRKSLDAFEGTQLTVFWTKNHHVLGYFRYGQESDVLVFANFSEHPQHIQAQTLSGIGSPVTELITEAIINTREELTLKPYQVVWLRVR